MVEQRPVLVQLVREEARTLLAAHMRRCGEVFREALPGSVGVEELGAPGFALVHLRGHPLVCNMCEAREEGDEQ